MTIKLCNHSFSKASFLIIFLLPLFRYYDVPGTSISSETVLSFLLLMCLIAAISLCRTPIVDSIELKRSRINFLIFGLWAFLITGIYEVFTSMNVTNPNSGFSVFALIQAVQVFVIIWLLLSGKIDGKDAFKIYEGIAKIVLFIFALQWLLLLTGVQVSFKLPLHEYNEASLGLNNIIFGMNTTPTSLFSEKAHFCQYLLPYLAICLYSDRLVRKRRMIKAVVVTVAMIMTVSGNGIIAAAILWLLYFLIFGKSKRGTRIFVAILGVAIMIIVFEILQRIDVFNSMFAQLFSDNSGGGYHFVKADYRIYRGFDLFGKLPILQETFGVGYRHMKMFATQAGIVSQFDSSNAAYEYFSSVTQVLLYFGVVGFIPFVNHLRLLLKTKYSAVCGTLILFITLVFSSAMFLDCSHMLYMAIIVIALDSEYCPLINCEREQSNTIPLRHS